MDDLSAAAPEPGWPPFGQLVAADRQQTASQSKDEDGQGQSAGAPGPVDATGGSALLTYRSTRFVCLNDGLAGRTSSRRAGPARFGLVSEVRVRVGGQPAHAARSPSSTLRPSASFSPSNVNNPSAAATSHSELFRMMDDQEQAPPTERELLSTVWVFPEFLQAVGPLHEGNVLEYFSHSPFFDRQSTNQQLKMQTIHTGQPVLDEAEELKRFTGTEFALVHARPPALFLIHKRERHDPDHTTTLATYSVINNNVYLSPTLDGVLSSRLTTAVDALHASMNTLRDRLAKEASFDPRGESQVVLTRQATVPTTTAADSAADPAVSTAAPATTAVNIQPSFTALRSALAVLPMLNRQSSTAPPSLAVTSVVDLARLGGSGASVGGGSTRGAASNAGTPTPGGPVTGRSGNGMVPTPPPTTGKSAGGGTGTPGSAGPSGLGTGGKGKKKKRKLDGESGGKKEDGGTSSPFTTTPVGV